MIKIDEHYTLTPSKHCWTLKYEKEGDINPDTDRPTITRRESFHGSFEQAIRKYADERLKDTVYDDAKHDIGIIISKLNRIEQTIQNIKL